VSEFVAQEVNVPFCIPLHSLSDASLSCSLTQKNSLCLIPWFFCLMIGRSSCSVYDYGWTGFLEEDPRNSTSKQHQFFVLLGSMSSFL
jgi:hypothetical protein